MPIKIPKAFPRRKSSGNELEEKPLPAEPSFRVLERPSVTRSFDGGQTFKRLSYARPLSEGHLVDDYLQSSNLSANSANRGSGGTNHSASSGGHDNSSSSARYSSTSTLPSSTDIPLDDRHAASKNEFSNMPAPPIPESGGMSFKHASRAFSFGRKKVEQSASSTPRPQLQQSQSDGFAQHNTRERAMTDTSFASGSTATPPRLLDTGFDLEKSDHDGFGSMFENFGKNSSQIDLNKGISGLDISGNSISNATDTPSKLTPAPLSIDRSRNIDPAPASWNSHHSNEALITSSPMERTFSYEEDAPLSVGGRGLLKSQTMPLADSANPQNQRSQQTPPSAGLRRSSMYGIKDVNKGESGMLPDDDARLVMDSINASKRLDRYSTAYSDNDENNSVAALMSQNARSPSPWMAQGQSRMPETGQRSPKPFSDGRDQGYSSQSWRQDPASAAQRTQRTPPPLQKEQSLFDAPSVSTSKRFVPPATKIQPPRKPQTQNKIMTPAEFERYRREQEMKSTTDARTKQDSSDDEDDYEDEDELEQSRQAARQRRKQEAHMSVYRQQMMKVTGEQPSDLPSLQLRPGTSTPNLRAASSIPEINFDKPVEERKASDDEDEDVPLGVLAAHGFPSKSRPPTAMGNPPSNIQYKSESYPPPPASSSGGSQGGRASGLPPFARNLPADPYYGASLVNPSNREPLAFGYAGSNPLQANLQPGIPPGGLVGVINAEEKARAARRGSPNSQGNFNTPLPAGMMPPGMPPIMTPGEQAQAQMSEQMTQMMQMQMQWMQQMQQMMASGMMPAAQQPSLMMPQMQSPMPMNPVMLPTPGPGQRPLSHGSPTVASPRPNQPRAMSMTGVGPSQGWQPHGANHAPIAPSMMNGGLRRVGTDYAPSITPSERSNVGMPSRYRPISIAPADEFPQKSSGSRTSTFTDGNLQPGSHGRNSRLSTSGDRSQSRLSSLRPASSTPPKKAGSDDDDEEGWEEMKKKRDKKKSTWRLNRKKEETQPQFEVYDYPEDA